jgi:hypothetical protein
MRKLLVLIFVLVIGTFSFAAVKPYIDAYFSTSLFQNVNDLYLKEHFGPYQYGYQYGDNRIYLRDTRLSFIFGLGVKQEDLFGSVELYANSFINGYTMLDINDGQVGYMDDTLTVEGFFKSRVIRMRNVPSEMFFNFMPSLNLFSSTFSKGHWFMPYFVYPVEFLDGSVEIFTTADEDTTNLIKSGKDYYGIYGSYYDGLIDVEGYFARNIYDSVGSLENFSNIISLPTGNYGGVKIGGAGNIGIGDVFVGVIYKESTSNTYLPYVKESDYRLGIPIGFYYSDTNAGVSYDVFSYLPISYGVIPSVSYNLIGGYLAFDMENFLYFNAEGGILRQVQFSASTNLTYNNIYANGGVVFKGIEGSKYEVSGVIVIPDNETNISMLGGDVKGFLNYYVPLVTDEDELKVLFKVGLRNTKTIIISTKLDNTSIIGVGNVGYNMGNISIDLLGYVNYNNISLSDYLVTNFTFGDVRLYIGYNIAPLIKNKELGNDLWIKIGGRGVVQTGSVNVGNVGENTILTPYVGIWYTIPKVNSYIVISYGWYGATSTRDVDLGRGLESTIIMYNGLRNWSAGLATSDNIGYIALPDGKVVNLGEYKLATEPTIRFDLYIKY